MAFHMRSYASVISLSSPSMMALCGVSSRSFSNSHMRSAIFSRLASTDRAARTASATFSSMASLRTLRPQPFLS